MNDSEWEVCDACGKYLETTDFPYLFRCYGNLCKSCKAKAQKILEEVKE
jgi:hypothetical protein